MYSLRSILFIIVTMCLTVPCFDSATAQKLSPARVKEFKKANVSYKSCKKAAIRELRIDTKKGKQSLSACKERFPGASLYIACKQLAVKKYRNAGKMRSKAISECKKFQIATKFDPKLSVPFFVVSGNYYFAGTGMNNAVPISKLNPPNFNCAEVKQSFSDPSKLQHILFGNNPKHFGNIGSIPTNSLAKKMGLKRPSPKGVLVKNFGKVFNNPGHSNGLVLFPSAPCHFNGARGHFFTGLSTYYLINRTTKMAHPYFALAWYKPGTGPSTATLIKKYLKILGRGYKAMAKDKYTTFLTASTITEIDAQRNPKNLCAYPRSHKLVGVVQSVKNNPNQPEHLLLANIENLCKFGDILAKGIR